MHVGYCKQHAHANSVDKMGRGMKSIESKGLISSENKNNLLDF